MKAEFEKQFNVQELNWAEARLLLQPVDDKLVSIIDALSPPKSFRCFVATYRYGDEILKRGKFYLPKKNGELVPLDDSQVPGRIQQQLGTNLGSNPPGVLLQGAMEQFMDLESRVMPFFVINPGRIYGMWRVLDKGRTYHPIANWDLTAGARSIFFLTKIGNQARHAKLKKRFNLMAEAPDSYKDQWLVFRELANCAEVEHPWQVQYFMFGKDWFDHLHDIAWQPLRYYLLEHVWANNSFARNQVFWHLFRNRFLSIKYVKPDLYIVDYVKHLFELCVTGQAAFAPAHNDNLAPVSRLQAIYQDYYGLDDYAPIIMQPTYYDMYQSNQVPIYSSLQFPTAMELATKTNEKTSAIDDLYKIKSFYDKCLSMICSGELQLQETPWQDIPDHIQVDFLHSVTEGYRGITNNNRIIDIDNNLRQLVETFPGKTLHHNCSFFRGCMLIHPKG